MKSIIFVCLGNICRSPLAEGIARNYIKEKNLDIKVSSAGTASWHEGKEPCERSIKVALEFGVDISKQRAKQVKKSDFSKYDLIIALDNSNLKDLQKLSNSAKNLQKLGFYGYNNECVPDPYYFTEFDGFYEVFKMIDTCVKNLIDNNF